MPDLEWEQSHHRVENLAIRKEEDELRFDSWIQISQQNGTKENLAVQ